MRSSSATFPDKYPTHLPYFELIYTSTDIQYGSSINDRTDEAEQDSHKCRFTDTRLGPGTRRPRPPRLPSLN